MKNLLKAVLQGNEKDEFDTLIQKLKATGRHYFLRNEFLQAFAQLCEECGKPQYFFHSSVLGELIQLTHEILIDAQDYWLVLRPSVAQQLVFKVEAETGEFDLMSPTALLDCRDRLVHCEAKNTFEINLKPFFNPELTIQDPRNVGQGFKFIHQFLVDKYAHEIHQWEEMLFQIIHQCRYKEHSFLIGPDIQNCQQLKPAIEEAYQVLKHYDDNDEAILFLKEFERLGLKPGWGNTVDRCRATLKLLERVMQCPDACGLEEFLRKIPNLFSIVSVSVHGWVGQKDVLGKAETAGQVAYVLDQARSLEKKLLETIELAGLSHLDIEPQVILLTRLIPNCEGTQCNTKFERLTGTQFSRILRIPFRDDSNDLVEDWLSKFQVWPYLDKFATKACSEVTQLLQGRKPDLIIGHYSDGNLVAYRMAKQLQTLHCSVAHSLEKTRHLFGDLHWQELESQYHFSKQFAADLISMNASNFILTSSQHEIFGNHDTIGQYESYECFTLPNLVHVINGVNLKSAKFTVVPPGVDDEIFFPYLQSSRRNAEVTRRLETELFSQAGPSAIGQLANPTRRPIFVFAPLQNGKNLPGLLKAYSNHSQLREQCNLILLTGQNQVHQAANSEQASIIGQLHQLIEDRALTPNVRWIGKRYSSEDLGEIYRIIADHNGVLLHGAHFEAFGLTLLEAMVSGVPVFSTKFGGASEIVTSGKNGFLINPTQMDEVMEQVLRFVELCDTHQAHWKSFSDAGIHHIQTHYNWPLHVNKVLTLTKIHKYLSQEDKSRQTALHQYLEALYRLIYQNESPWSAQFSGQASTATQLNFPSEEMSSSST